MNQLQALCTELENDIKRSYEEGITVEEAERLAGKFLSAQLQLANHLQSSDLDARMKKSGIKAVKAAVYMDAATKGEKKPSDTFLQSIVDMNELVQGEQKSLDEAEVNRDYLQSKFNIYKEAHIHFRAIAKGRFE